MQEASETQCWLEFAYACRYVSSELFERLNLEYEQIIGMLSSTEIKADKFCY
jgi:four helix bundle protein